MAITFVVLDGGRPLMAVVMNDKVAFKWLQKTVRMSKIHLEEAQVRRSSGYLNFDLDLGLQGSTAHFQALVMREEQGTCRSNQASLTYRGHGSRGETGPSKILTSVFVRFSRGDRTLTHLSTLPAIMFLRRITL